MSRKKKREVSEYTSQLPEYMNDEEVKSVLLEVLDLVTQRTTDTAGFMLARRGLYEQRLRYWITNYEELGDIYKAIRSIEKEKLENRLINNDSNPTGTIFLLKANHGLIEEDKRRQLENDKEIAEMNQTIEIGFVSDED